MEYKFRITKPIEDDFICEVAIDGEHTFLQLHELLAKQLKFDSALMASFFPIMEGERGREIALMEMFLGDDSDEQNTVPMVMDVVKIKKIVSMEVNELEYVYDIFSDRYLIVDFMGEYVGDIPCYKEPICLFCDGELPLQSGFDFDNDFEGSIDSSTNLKGELDTSFMDEFDDFSQGYEDDNYGDFFDDDEGYSQHASLDDYLDKL